MPPDKKRHAHVAAAFQTNEMECDGVRLDIINGVNTTT